MLNTGISCNQCVLCLQGEHTECLYREGPQPPSLSSVDEAPHFFGGFGEYFYARKGIGIIKLPEQLSDEHVIPFACAGPTVIHALRNISLQSVKTALVQGAGPVGLFCCLYLKKRGVESVYLVDLHESRLNLAKNVRVDNTFERSRMDGEALEETD